MKFLSIFFALLVFAGCAALPPPPPVRQTLAYDHLITEDRVGPIYVGMPVSQLREVIGRKDRIFDFSGYLYVDWYAEDIEIYIRSDYKTICSITVSTPTYKTAEGIQIQSKESALRLAYGNPSKKKQGPGGWVYWYSKPNIQFTGQTLGDIVTTIGIGQCPSAQSSDGKPTDL